MFLYPENIFEKLEFDKIIELCQRYCKGQKAKDILASPTIFGDPSRIDRMLKEVAELKQMIEDGVGISLRHYTSVDEILFWLRKIDYVLEIENILHLYDHILSIYELKEFFKSKKIKLTYPKTSEILEQVEFDTLLIKSYHKIFDEEGQIKPNASPDLAKVSKLIDSKTRELNKTFDKMANDFARSGYLKDNKETLRNGRRVMSVQAEHKRKIKGIIHDESSTGRTVYIEPEEILYINNQLVELESQKRHEIRKILAGLCDTLRPFADDFELWQRILVRLDLINAKAKLAMEYDGHAPKISEKKVLNLKKARHPLLVILHNKANKKVVPFDVNIDNENRILVISGPNAGGKSVTMKAIGLNSLMLQTGMLIPVLPDSEVGLFKGFMVDIGDQQSLEDDLSTYSSHLKNMGTFLGKASRNSLFLIDEFGSGTDPKLGGAIAEAILHSLVKKQALGVITTHYSNIKMYAYKNTGLLNGAMEFNKEELKPTYKLNVGKPGSSFAFEIAENAGLPGHVLRNAQKNAGAGTKSVEQLLVDLQEEKRQYEAKLSENKKEKERLQKLIKSYESAFGDLEFKRKKLKMEKKELKLSEMNASELELKTLIKQLKEEKKLEDAKELAEKLKQERQEVVGQINDLKEEVFYSDDFDPAEITVGSFVKMRSGGDPAEILAIEKEVATLSMGFMQVRVPVKELVPAKIPIQINQKKSVNAETVHNPFHLERKLDIRGYTKMDAEDHLQEYLDNALMSNLSTIKIIHGKGNGILRKTVLSKLKEYKDVKKIWHPEDEEGGQGVTYVEF